jgi:hypothetical protein
VFCAAVGTEGLMMLEEEESEEMLKFSPPSTIAWDRWVSDWFSYLIWFYMVALLIEGIGCGAPHPPYRRTIEVRGHINVLPGVECGDSQVFFGWPIVALIAFSVSRKIESRCDTSGGPWLIAGGRFRWIGLWLLCFFCGTRLLKLIW